MKNSCFAVPFLALMASACLAQPNPPAPVPTPKPDFSLPKPAAPLSFVQSGGKLPFDYGSFSPALNAIPHNPFKRETADEKSQMLMRGNYTIGWRMPADLPAGYYFVEWDGVAPDTMTEWEEEAQPYLLRTGSGPREAKLAAYSFEVDAKNRRDVPILHYLLKVPARVTKLRSDRPIKLEPGQFFSMQSRTGQMSVQSEPRLVPVDVAQIPTMEVVSGVPYNLFDDTKKPRFEAKINSLNGANWSGKVRAVWLDALTGKTQTQTVGAQSGTPVVLEWTPPFGVYTLNVELLNARDELLLRQQRHFSYSPLVDSTKLPEKWPFAWHTRGESTIPPVGFKYYRVFTSWRDMEPAQGKYDCAAMDKHINQPKERGAKILWVCAGTPLWATSRPDLPSSPRKPYRGVYMSKPPKDWQMLRDFLRAYLNRYAPNGDASVLGSIEVLNEPNAHGPDVEFSFAEYTEMCKVVWEEVKKHSPQIKVVGISQSGGLHMWWVNGVLDAGAGKYMDVASAHGYETTTPVGPVSIDSKFTLLRQALDKRGLQHVEMWDTETGVGGWGRRGGVIPSDLEMEERARKAPEYNPRTPGRIRNRWRGLSEWGGSAMMVRSSAQKIVLKADPVFYFKWDAGSSSWMQDRIPEGNPIPKMMIPVQAVQSHLWMRYAIEGSDPIKIASPNKDFIVFAHRFKGPQGRLTVLYAHPKTGGLVVTDEVAANAPGAILGEQIITEDDGKLIAKLPVFDAKLFDVVLPELRPGAVTLDILAREMKTIGADRKVGVAQTPVYIIEPNGGAKVWPN